MDALHRPDRTRRTWQIDVSLIAVAIVWGGSYLAAKDVAEQISVPSLLALRFVITLVGMVVVWLFVRARVMRREWVVGAVLGISQTAILYLETWGVHLTSATNAGLIISLSIIFTPLLESVWLRRWLPRPFFIAVTLAVVGIALLVSGSGFHAPTLGDVLMLAAATVRAVHVTASGVLTRRVTMSTVNVTLVQAITGTALTLAFAGADTLSAVRTLNLAGWGGLIFLGLACSVFAFLVQLWGIRRTSASRASLLLGTEPIWAVLVGVTLGGEALTVVAVIGAVLIVGSTYWAQAIESRHRLGPGTDQGDVS